MLRVTIVILAIIASVLVYRFYVETPASTELNDRSNDVDLNMGTQYPGVVDVLNARLDTQGTTLNLTIGTRGLEDPFSSLGSESIAQWNVTMILENETDVLKAYEVNVAMNSTHLTCNVMDVETQNVLIGQVSYRANSLVMTAVMDKLAAAKTIEWRILSNYERYSGGELIVSASDLAPDEGFQKTTFLTRELLMPSTNEPASTCD